MSSSRVKWLIIDDLFISFATNGTVEDKEWGLFLEDLQSKPVKRYLAVSVGTLQLTSLQRKQVAEVVTRRSIPIAAVTDERLVRGVVTAISWLGANIKAFSWAEMQDALVYLGLRPSIAAQVTGAVLKIKSELLAPR